MPYPWSAGNVLTATDLNSSIAAKTDTAMTQNAQTGTSYSYALADASKLLSMSNAASNTVLVTKQATVTWVTGTQLRVVNLGAGVTTLVADTGVTINNNKALSQYQGGTLIRTASDVWLFVPTSSGAVLQVKSTAKTDTFTSNAASYAYQSVTGLSVAITPTSASNKILISVNSSWFPGGSNVTAVYLRVLRDATAIGVGDAAGSRLQAGWGNVSPNLPYNGDSLGYTFLDTPNSTSALVYQVQVATNGVAARLNFRGDDANTVDYLRSISTITAMEVTP